MTAHFARDRTLFALSDHFSRRAEAPAPMTGWEAWIVRLVRSATTRLRDHFHRRAVLRDLNKLSDRELADLGLARAELHRVFEPGFEAVRRDL